MAGDINVKMRLDNEGKFKNSVREINTELKAMQAEIRAVDAESKGHANTLDSLTKRQESLTRAQQAAEKLQEQLAKAVENAQKNYSAAADQTKKYKQQLDDAQKSGTATKKEIADLTKAVADSEKTEQRANIAVQSWTRQLNDAKAANENLKSQVADGDKYIKEARESFDNTAKSVDEYGKKTEAAADSVEIMAEAMAASGLKAKLEEIRDMLLECAEAAQTYQTAVAKVSTLAGGDMSAISDGLLQMANDLGVSAPALAESMYQALSASIAEGEAMEFVRKSTKLSIGGFTEAATAVDVLTTVINAYGLEAKDAERISDVLVQTQNKGRTTVDALAQSLGQVIPTAAAYNVSLDNLAASYILLTRGGINTANATTYIRSMLTELGDTGSEVSKKLYELSGKNFAQLSSEGRSLGDVLSMLSDTVNNDSTAFANLWGNQRAGQGALAIVNAGTEEFTQALTDLATAEGVAEANYEKMAGTSERANARLETSMENLKIVVGQQLLGPLNNVRGTFAEIVQAITAWVQEHPMLVKVIGALVTGLTLLTAAMAGYVAITKIAEVAANAFKTAIAGSVVGQVVLAVSAVIAAITALIAIFGDLKDETQILAEDTAALAEEHAEAADKYAKTSKEFRSAMAAAEDATEKATKAEEAYNTALERRKEILVENAKAEDALEDAESELTKTEKAYDAAIEATIAAGGDASTLITDRTKKLKNLNQAQKDANEILAENEEALKRVETETQYYSIAMADLDEKSRAAVDAFLAEADGLDHTSEKYREAIEDVYHMSEAHDELTAGIQADIDSINNEMENLKAEYDSVYETAYNSLTGQFGLFETVSIETAQSVTEMISALESQAAYMETYSANLASAIQLGLSDGLVQALSDGSAESAAILQSIVDDGGANIDQLNAQFERVSEGKDAFAQQMAAAATDYDARMSDIESRLNTAVGRMNKANQAYAAAVNTIRGNIQGAESMRGPLMDMYASLAASATEAYNRKLKIHSPSRVFEQSGVYSIEGIILAARKMLPKVQQSFADVGAATISGYKEGASAIPAINQYSSPPATYVTVNLGDKELTNAMYSGVVKKISTANRNNNASAGRRA